MRKAWFISSLLCIVVSFFGATQAQTRRIIKNPKAVTQAEILKPNEEGCGVKYYVVYKRSAPSDVVGTFNYLYNALLKRNHFIAIEYSCAPVVKSIDLSRTEIAVNPEPARRGICSPESQQINVSIVALDQDNDPLIYHYSVSGGKIIGTGAKVVWDLSDAQPGVYKINVLADDGCGVCNEPAVKEVKVVECVECCAQTPNEK